MIKSDKDRKFTKKWEIETEIISSYKSDKSDSTDSPDKRKVKNGLSLIYKTSLLADLEKYIKN